MAEALLIYSDSQTVVKQVLHEWSINGDRLHNFAMNAWELSKGKNVRFEWIPSKSNKAGKMMGS